MGVIIMFDFLWQYISGYGELVIRLALAIVCGYSIGYERKNRKKEAGIRTHIIVCIASCLMMEISKYGFADITSAMGDMKADGSRIASQIVSGIGFLGAGMIFVHKNSIKGLTTAAGIWATSGIGMAIGAGMYFIGIVTTIMIVLLQIVLHKNIRIFRRDVSEVIVFEIANKMSVVHDVQKLLEENSIQVENISMQKLDNDRMQITADVTHSEYLSIFDLSRKAIENEDIYSVYNES